MGLGWFVGSILTMLLATSTFAWFMEDITRWVKPSARSSAKGASDVAASSGEEQSEVQQGVPPSWPAIFRWLCVRRWFRERSDTSKV
jgi:hypothetical protein